MSSNFDLDEDQTLIVDTVRKFVADSIEPKALDNDEHGTFTGETLEGLAELGLLALPVPEESGGAGMGMVAFAAVLEEIAGACGATARLLLEHAGACGLGLAGVEGADELLGEIIGGEKIATFVGLDAGVAFAGDALTGTTPVAMGAAEASVFVVAARREDGVSALFAVDGGSVQRTPSNALGFRAGGNAAVAFDAVPGRLLAEGDAAAAAIDRAEKALWLGGAAMAVGMARQSVVLAKRHADERIAFGKPLARQQAVATKLAECSLATDGARHQVYHAARSWDAGSRDGRLCAMARLSAVRAAIAAGDEAIQIHGGYGYTVEYVVERHYRDAMALQVMDRGSAHLRDVIAV